MNEINPNFSRKVFRTVVRSTDPIVRDHRVHGLRVMPGVTFLDLFHRAATAAGFGERETEFRNVVFPEAIALAEGGSREVEIELLQKEGGFEVTARSREITDGGDLGTPFVMNASAQLSRVKVSEAGRVDVARLKSEATASSDLDEMYAGLRRAGIQHFEFMKTRGPVFQHPRGTLVEARLSDLARRSGQFYLHPALLDTSTALSFFSPQAKARYHGQPFIPMFIERFRAWRPIAGQCLIWAPQSVESESMGADLGKDPEILILSETGGILVRFENLTFKRIRSPESLLRKPGANAGAPAAGTATTTTPAPPTRSTSAHAKEQSERRKEIARELRILVARALRTEAEQIDPAAGFYDLGLESSDLLSLANDLEGRIGQPLYPTLLFEHPSVEKLAAYLDERHPGAIIGAAAQIEPATEKRAQSVKTASEVTTNIFSFDWVDAGPSLRARHGGDSEAGTSNAVGRGNRALLVFGQDEDWTRAMDRVLKSDASDRPLLRVSPGSSFLVLGKHHFQVRPSVHEDCQSLLEELNREGIDPEIFLFPPESICGPHEASRVAQTRDRLEWVAGMARALAKRRSSDPVRLIYLHRNGLNQAEAAAVGGFATSLRKEAPRVGCRVVGLPDAAGAAQEARLAWEEICLPMTRQNGWTARHEGGRRLVWKASLQADSIVNPPTVSALRHQGVYLVTGGAGGLGLSLAQYLATEWKATLILLGRSELTTEQRGKIAALEAAGAEIIYLRTDVADAGQVAEALETARERFSRLDGVFHLAGVLENSLIHDADEVVLRRVLRPKADGAIALDEATKNERLDFFVMFSSLSAAIGNVGQAHYAAANGFMDGFATVRRELTRQNLRHGNTFSINWPLWAEGGMQVSARTAARMADEAGLAPLTAAAGWRALESILASGLPRCAVAAGEVARVSELLNAGSPRVATEVRTESPRVPSDQVVERTARHHYRPEDIAIIGVSGRYPGARDLEQFHQNLSEGRDCITEIPTDRWDHARYFDADRSKPGKCYARWGGFLEDVDKFDPVFFNISPREAELMDPQERLFLETVWAAMENAGYNRAALARPGVDRKVGVFAGVMWGSYQMFAAEELTKGHVVTANSPYWSIANRVSHVFDLSGPSLAVDTACSSSLAAIHLACESLRRGECRMAVAGGVNLSLHPSKYLLLAQLGMLSTHGRCKSFGAGGDGYVPGEGVGAVILKSAVAAERDGDTIHAIIRGSALNHDGRGSGFTAPNPNAQAQVIKEALAAAGVPARSISYIEAHGTGTALGDPVELAGIGQVFARQTSDRGFCAIGSVKSVIGHLEAAAGISAVTKVLLQFKHQKLYPSLHATELNQKIDFRNSPCKVQRELAEWARPRSGGQDEPSHPTPRRAGVSSFGAGGANVHLVLEEPAEPVWRTPSTRTPEVFLLSAQNEDRLRALAGRMREHLATSEGNFGDILHTLQIGREQMDARLAFTAATRQDAVDKLAAYLANNAGGSVWTGLASRKVAELLDPEARVVIDAWLSDTASNQRQTETLGRLWAGGASIDWWQFPRADYRRVPLPSYPFAGRRCWLPRLSDLTPPPRQAESATLEGRKIDAIPCKNAAETGQALLFQPVWWESPASNHHLAIEGSIVVMGANWEFARALRPLAGNARVVLIDEGLRFEKKSADHYVLNLEDPSEYQKLFTETEKDGQPISAVTLHWRTGSWNSSTIDSDGIPNGTDPLDRLYSWGKALSAVSLKGPLRLLVLSVERGGPGAMSGAAGGFLRSLRLELPRLVPSCVSIDQVGPEQEAAIAAVELTAMDFDSRHHDGKRFIRRWIRPENPLNELLASTAPLLKRGGVYVIAGGAGGIGLIVARHLASKYSAKLGLLGRRVLSGSGEKPTAVGAMAEMEKAGGEVCYLNVDIRDQSQLEPALAKIRTRFGRIDGIIHSAGLADDRSLSRKSLDSFHDVTGAKIRGTVLLDQLTRSDPLDFFCLFSSITAVFGNLGQCDYAAGNAFMDAFAAERDKWRASGQRFGKTISINWPLWSEGGMKADESVARALEKQGLHPLSSSEGIRRFEQALRLPTPQVLVWTGPESEFERRTSREDFLFQAPVNQPQATDAEAGKARALMMERLARILSSTLKLDPSEITEDEDFATYGLDSIMAKDLLLRINSEMGDLLDPFMLAEANTLRSLATRLVELHPASAETPSRDGFAKPESEPDSTLNSPAFVPAPAPVHKSTQSVCDEIAVIGMAVRFPGANDIDEFWKNLLAGTCAIGEAPTARWPDRAFYSQDEKVRGKSYSKWGGFIEGVDEFDPEFFGYSEDDARMMDPAHRLFLEIAARAMEDAGLWKDNIGGSVGGVFVGARQGDYAEMVGVERLLAVDSENAWRFNSACMLPNRVANFFNLRGPACVVDTACSSSLVSAHMACESLRRGECDFAIAGGVELLLTPKVLVHFSQSKSLARDGACRPFESQAGGTVLGEGCGAVVLKPLTAALRDGDDIHAVIRGSAMNNYGGGESGKEHAETMTSVMREAWRKSRSHPGGMGYLELHGEGSLLRDAVELRAAREVWEGTGGNSGSCPIGSVKANIGHLLLASGVAGLIKACLILRHGKAPPHPFKAVLAKYAGLEAAERRLPVEALELSGNVPGEPRIVGVNSTGIAGTNCFMVCAESPRPAQKRPKVPRPMNKRSFWLGPPPIPEFRERSRAREILCSLRDGKIDTAEAKTRLGLETRHAAGPDSEQKARMILEGLRSGEIAIEAAKAGLVRLSAYRRDVLK